MICFVHRCKQSMPRMHVHAIFQLSPHSRACHTLPIAAAAQNSRVLVVPETLQRALRRYKPPFSQHNSCRTSHSHLDCKQRIACCVRKQTAHSVTAVTATQHAVQSAAASHSCATALILKLLMLTSLAQQIHCSPDACNHCVRPCQAGLCSYVPSALCRTNPGDAAAGAAQPTATRARLSLCSAS